MSVGKCFWYQYKDGKSIPKQFHIKASVGEKMVTVWIPHPNGDIKIKKYMYQEGLLGDMFVWEYLYDRKVHMVIAVEIGYPGRISTKHQLNNEYYGGWNAWDSSPKNADKAMARILKFIEGFYNDETSCTPKD